LAVKLCLHNGAVQPAQWTVHGHSKSETSRLT
jgi:hypothetical protein